MYGSSLRLVTRMPREARIAASDAAAMPLPSEETTPPVTKTNLVMATRSRKFAILPGDRADARTRRPGGGAPTAREAERGRSATRTASRPSSASTASIAGVCGVPATSTRSGIMTCGGFRPCRAAAAFSAAPIASRVQSSVGELGVQLGERRRGWRRSTCSASIAGVDVRRRVEVVRGIGHLDQRGRRGRAAAPPPRPASGPPRGSSPARSRYGTSRAPSSSSGSRFMCSWFTQLSLSASKRDGDGLMPVEVEPVDELARARRSRRRRAPSRAARGS